MGLGRPSDYREEFNNQAHKLCLLGATDKEMAKFFEVSPSTLNLWKKEHPDFSESIKRGKIVADAETASSLFKRANGYSYDEVSYEKVTLDTEDNENIKVDTYKKKVVTKEIVPDVTAQIFWLKNRQKDKWRDKQSIEHTGKDGKPIQTELVTRVEFKSFKS